MTIKKIFSDNDSRIKLVCPVCRKNTILDLSAYKKILEPVTIERKCQCGHIHTVILERRKFYRKDVDLPGLYSHRGETAKKTMTVVDLSRSGIRFEVPGPPDFSVGDRLDVEFRLDNVHKTLIKKDVWIRSISGRQSGAEFCSREMSNPYDKAYDMAIGFYTFPKVHKENGSPSE